MSASAVVSVARRRCRPHSPPWCATTSSGARGAATASSIRCFANGWPAIRFRRFRREMGGPPYVLGDFGEKWVARHTFWEISERTDAQEKRRNGERTEKIRNRQ